MDKRKQWQLASQKEKLWWQEWKKRADLKSAKQDIIDRANGIKKSLNNRTDLKILQIGPAANGEIHFLPGERYALDPLADYFKAEFPELIDPQVKFQAGQGEELPFDNNFFDVILIINVLDHCHNPDQVMQEIFRCLKKTGLVLIRGNIYSNFASFLHNIFGFLDQEHPYAITEQYIVDKLGSKYEIKEKIVFATKAPKHSLIKNTIFSLLKLFNLMPTDLKVLAAKR